MSYHITLSKSEPSSGITPQEWRDFLASRPELEVVEENAHFISAVLLRDSNLILHYSAESASVFTKNPDGPQIIEYMVSIAPHFDGVVTGDEGETFATETDLGTQNDWNSQKNARNSRITEEKPWWKLELSRGKRMILGLLLGLLIVIIKEIFFTQ
ncbi:hypothetical protein GCM10023213_00280 [Prosthecobacter algae]|uniref:Uncharacterized protein n=1 Tax=Prosthecobacter algae TaxID=1144682 RepID=A0ABP9NR50_9BACT